MQWTQTRKNLPNPSLTKESVAILYEGKAIYPNIFRELSKWKDGKRLISIKGIRNVLYLITK